MSTILFVQENVSYLMTSLQERLERQGHKVISHAPRMEELSQVKEPVAAMVIYGEEEMAGQEQPLIYLKDKAVEEDIPVFVIGNLQELDTIRNMIPSHVIQREFKRPINVNEVEGMLDNYLKNFAKENKKKILVVDDSGRHASQCKRMAFRELSGDSGKFRCHGDQISGTKPPGSVVA